MLSELNKRGIPATGAESLVEACFHLGNVRLECFGQVGIVGGRLGFVAGIREFNGSPKILVVLEQVMDHPPELFGHPTPALAVMGALA
jgi:hypothetical protein